MKRTLLLAFATILLAGCRKDTPPVSPAAYNTSSSAKDTSILGQDSDKDNVRDDLADFIEKKVPAEAKAASMRVAAIYPEKFAATTDAQALDIAVDYQARLGCLAEKLPADWYELATQIRARALNNEARLNAHMRYEKLLEGQIVVEEEEVCAVN